MISCLFTYIWEYFRSIEIYRYNSILSGLIEYLIDLIDFYLLKMEILKYLEIKISYVTNIVNEKNHRIIIPLIFHSTWNYFLKNYKRFESCSSTCDALNPIATSPIRRKTRIRPGLRTTSRTRVRRMEHCEQE